MCYEDVKIGMRRYAKYTVIAAGTQFPANTRRVLLRIALFSNNVLDSNGQAIPEGIVNGNYGAMFVNANQPVDEIWLERHGTAVMGAWFIVPTNNMIVTEIFDDELYRPPAPGSPYNKL